MYFVFTFEVFGLQCLKCSAQFAKSVREIACPDCSSTMVIEMITPSPDEKETTPEPLESHNSSSVSVPIVTTTKNASETEQKADLASNESSPTTVPEECRVGYVSVLVIRKTVVLIIVIILWLSWSSFSTSSSYFFFFHIHLYLFTYKIVSCFNEELTAITLVTAIRTVVQN